MITWWFEKNDFYLNPILNFICFSSDKKCIDIFLEWPEFSYLHRLIQQKRVCMCSDIHPGLVLNKILRFDMDSESKGRCLCEKKGSVKFAFDI